MLKMFHGWKMKAICPLPLKVWASITKLKLLWQFPLNPLTICLLLAQSMMASAGTWSPLPSFSLISATKPANNMSHGCFSKEIYQPSRWWHLFSDCRSVLFGTNRRYTFSLAHKKLDMHFPVSTMAADCLIQRPEQWWFRLCLTMKLKWMRITQCYITFLTILSRRMWQSCVQFLNLLSFWNMPSENPNSVQTKGGSLTVPIALCSFTLANGLPIAYGQTRKHPFI